MAKKHVVDSESEEEPDRSSVKRLRTGDSSSLPRSSPPAPPSDAFSSNEVEKMDEDQVDDEDEDDEDDEDEASSEEDVDEEQKQKIAQALQDRNSGEGVSLTSLGVALIRKRVAEKGVIEHVYLENFMCHEQVSVNFGPQINFLIGNNGSGKSAILTGITMALGGNAKATNRAPKGAGLVKEGKTTAKCLVRLQNRGADAYQHHIYGDSITIERTIRVSGGGSYKIMNHEKVTVETQKATVDAILDHFNIQVENPMTVLTQDQSRQFLASASATQKYQFFLRGTQLAQLTEEYEALHSNTMAMHAALEKKGEVIPDLKDAYSRAKDRAKLARAAVGQTEKVEVLKNQLAWCDVEELESKIIRLEELIRAEEPTIKKIEDEMSKYRVEKTKAEEQITDLEQAQHEIQNEIELKQPRLNELKAKLAKAKEKGVAFNSEKRSIGTMINRLKDNIKDFEQQLVAERARLERDFEAEQRPIREKIARLEDQQLEKSKVSSATTQEREELAASKTPLVDELDELKQSIGRAKNEAQDIRSRIQQVERSKQNAMLAYGQNIPNLLRSIDADRTWIEKPLGPLGRYIELKDPKFASVVEAISAQTLNAFIVCHPEDQRKLSQMFRSHHIDHNYPIIKLNYDDRFDTSQSEPAEDVSTVLRIVKITHELARQAFINSVQPENAALVAVRMDAEVLLNRNPRNVRLVYSADMFEVRRNAGLSNTRSIDRWKGSRINRDPVQEIARYRADLERTQGEIQRLEGQKAEVDRRLAEVHSKDQELERRGRQARGDISKLNREIEKAKQSMQEKDPSRIAAIEELREASQAELDSILAQWTVAIKAHEEESVELAPLAEEKKTIEEELEKKKKSAQRLLTAINAAITIRVNMDSNIKQYTAKLERQRAKVDALRGGLESETANLETVMEQAMEICERPQPAKKLTAAQLKSQISSLERALKAREREQGASIEDIMKDLAVREKVLKDANAMVISLKTLAEALQTAYDVRLSRWTEFRDQIAMRARMTFGYHLSARGFSGKLHFNHDKGFLSISVQTDEQVSGERHKRKDAKSLSGGEKSFSTICLLLTMWDAVDCSLRCLDEFDVFMDAVNRRISMKMMVDTAKVAKAVQFILITPQGMSGSNYGPETKIIRLQDPGRDQGRLAFGA